MIPKVPEVRVEDVKALFKVQSLPKIDGRPSYVPLDKARETLSRNATAIETLLGGGNHGHLGLVLKPAVYLVEAGVAFNVPASAGIFPTFAQGATERKKGCSRQLHRLRARHQESQGRGRSLSKLADGGRQRTILP